MHVDVGGTGNTQMWEDAEQGAVMGCTGNGQRPTGPGH